MEDKGLSILWATDGSEHARGAIPLLSQFLLPAAKQLIVLHVSHALLPITLRAKRQALAEGYDSAARDLRSLDLSAIQLKLLSRWGHPIETILRTARTTNANLIVLGAKGHSALGLLLLGGVANGVVQHATRPVLIARPGSGSVSRILVGYDGSRAARQAVRFLLRLPLREVELRVCHVVEPFGIPRGTPISYRKLALAEVHKINQRRHRQAERGLRAVAQELEAIGARVSTEVLSGVAAPELDAMARNQHADLLVVGSRKPNAARHYLLGSTAEKLVRHSHTSVLVVR